MLTREREIEREREKVKERDRERGETETEREERQREKRDRERERDDGGAHRVESGRVDTLASQCAHRSDDRRARHALLRPGCIT